MADHGEHQAIADVRLHRGIDDDVKIEDVAKYEALQLSLLDRAQREAALRDWDNKCNDYDQRLGTNLRKTAQTHRFKQYLKTAHERLKAAGR